MAILALLGGIYALKRRKWGLALAGSIAAIFSWAPVVLILTPAVIFGSAPLGIFVVIIVVKSKGEFALYLRIPAWAKGTTVEVNGKDVSGVNAGTYLEIARTWKSGDRVRLDMPMRVQLIQANPLVEQLRNQIALFHHFYSV